MFRHTKRDLKAAIDRVEQSLLKKGDKAGREFEFKEREGRNNRRIELIRDSVVAEGIVSSFKPS